MIELALSGAYRGAPHEVGAWAFRLRREDLVVGEGRGRERPDRVTSRLSAQAAALALGLEAIAREWAGEEVVVRGAGAALEGLFRQGGPDLPESLRRWVRKARAASESLAAVRILPGAPEDLRALEAVVRELLPGETGRPRLARASELRPFRRARR